MGKVIGIDLGTTHSSVAIRKIVPETIPNQEGGLLTPSYVSQLLKKRKGGLLAKSALEKEWIVGKVAKDWQAQDPKNTITSIKRLLGRKFYDSEVQKILADHRISYEIRPYAQGTENSIAVLLHGEEYLPEQISAEILKKIKRETEAYLGEPVDAAVVTVPAYFNDKQKNATRMAASLAGLPLLRLIPEPTAAAISFGLFGSDNVKVSPDDPGKTLLVFDFGGGTLDLSVLALAGNQFIEMGKGGDSWLGGDDIDQLIIEFVYRKTAEKSELVGLPDASRIKEWIQTMPEAERNRFIVEMKNKAEAAKIHLSTHPSVVIEVLGLLRDSEQDWVDIEVELTREEFEVLLEPIAVKAVGLVNQLLTELHFSPSLIDQVLMVGGTSIIPLFAKKLKAVMGETQVVVHERPLLAIAEGAAILAHQLAAEATGLSSGDPMTSEAGVNIVHTASHDYLLELENGELLTILERNTPLPFKKIQTLHLSHSDQKLAHFRFFNPVNLTQELVGDLWLAFDPSKMEEGDQELLKVERTNHQRLELTLDFEVDESNVIKASASLKGLPQVQVSRTLSRGGPDEKILKSLEEGILKVNRDKPSFFVASEFCERAVDLAAEVNQVLDSETQGIDQEVFNHVTQKLGTALDLLERGETCRGNIFYAESFHEKFSKFISLPDLKIFEEKLARLKALDEAGTVDEIVTTRKELISVIDQYPLFQCVEKIDNAYHESCEHDPSKAEWLGARLAEMEAAMEDSDRVRFDRVMRETLPEAIAVLRKVYDKGVSIHKGIAL